ncbi:MAG: hypothetical protein OER95_15625 [Acidimicrobiia bacterium]|nr:hypothetical protein [Acidimicrobiia bacterium]
MDHVADGLPGRDVLSPVSGAVSGFDRGRRALARFTVLMVALSIAFAVIGYQAGSRLVADRTARSLSMEGMMDPAGATMTPLPAPSTTAPSTTAPPVTSTTPAPAPSPTTIAPLSTTVLEPATTAPSTPATVTPTTDPAAGDTTRDAPADNSPEARGRRALAALSFPWESRLPGWTIVFLDGRSGLYGLTLVDDKRIEVYVRNDQSQDLLVHIVAHEIGHAVDVTLNDGPDRRRWQDIRGIGADPWWPDAAASDFRTGAGDFAESFAYWQTGSANYRSKLGPPPNEAQLQLMAELAHG